MTTQPTVLLIDDNADNLRVAVEHLEAYSLSIRTARDGQMGLRRARAVQPELILLDVEMPGIDGYETCRRLKADPACAGIPVIFMTARTSVEDTIRGFDVGGVDYVTKPFESRELLARVRTHLDLQGLRRQLASDNVHLKGQVSQQSVSLGAALSSRESVDAELVRLVELVRVQSEEIRRISQQWNTRNADLLADPTASLRKHVVDRIRLVGANLRQSVQLLPEGTDGEAWRAHLDQAIELVEPLLTDDDLTEAGGTRVMDSPLQALSERERAVLQLVADGRSTSEISYELDLAISTVSTYRKRIREKTGVESLGELIALHLRTRQ